MVNMLKTFNILIIEIIEKDSEGEIMVLISADVIHSSGSQKIATKVSSSCILQFSIQERERGQKVQRHMSR